MGLPRLDEYRARVDECNQRAAVTEDFATKAEWQKLANSWQALARKTETARVMAPN